MSHVHEGPLAQYCSLTDRNLSGYFATSRMRRHLKKAGLVDKRGHIISENQYRLNMARKEHKKHVKDLLAQAIVHKTLDIERNRQVEIKRKLEEISKLELVRRVRAETKKRSDSAVMPLLTPKLRLPPPLPVSESVHEEENALTPNSLAQKFRKGDEDILPYLSPRSSRPQSRAYRPRSAPADRQYNDSYEPSVIYVDDEGRPVTPPSKGYEDENGQKREEIDTRHLYALDSAALKKYALTLSKMEQGEGLASPYLISQVPSPPRSARGSTRNSYRDNRFKQSRLNRPRTANSLSPYRSQRTGAVQGTLMLHRQEPAMMHQGEVQTLCEVTMKYYGPNLILPRDQRDPTQDVEIEQQHCGGNTLPVFKERIKPGDEFTFISRRHRGYPFSLSIFVEGRISARVSTCCEYGHAKGVRLGGKMGQFCLKRVNGATPCYRCKLNSQASPRTLKRPASKKKEQKVEEIKEEIIVLRPEKKEKEEEEEEEHVEVPVEGAHSDDDDDNTRSHKAYIKTDTDSERSDNLTNKQQTAKLVHVIVPADDITKLPEDKYDDDFEDEESGSKKDSGTDESYWPIRGERCEEDDDDESDWSDIEEAKAMTPVKIRRDRLLRSSTPVVDWDEDKEKAIISREDIDDDLDGKKHVHFDEDVQCIAASEDSDDTRGQKESDEVREFKDYQKELELEQKLKEFLDETDTCDEVSEIETDHDSPRRQEIVKPMKKSNAVSPEAKEVDVDSSKRKDNQVKRLQKQDKEEYSDDFDSVSSPPTESSSEPKKDKNSEISDEISSESTLQNTGEYKKHVSPKGDNKTAPVKVVSPLHVHVKKNHNEQESPKVEERPPTTQTVVVQEKGDNFEIRHDSEDEDSNMELRREGPMSITFSEMNIIGPLATLLVKVRRQNNEKRRKRSKKQLLIMIDESETETTQAEQSSGEITNDVKNQLSEKENDTSESKQLVSESDISKSDKDVKIDKVDKQENTGAENKENASDKSESVSEKKVCQGRLKPIQTTRPKSRVLKKSRRIEESDTSLSSVNSLSESLPKVKKQVNRRKPGSQKVTQPMTTKSDSEEEAEKEAQNESEHGEQTIDQFDRERKGIAIQVAPVPTTQNVEKDSNVRFIKPRLLHREYDDDDEPRDVRMTKMEEDGKPRVITLTDEDILRQMIQSTFDESYEVSDDVSVIDLDEDDPSEMSTQKIVKNDDNTEVKKDNSGSSDKVTKADNFESTSPKSEDNAVEKLADDIKINSTESCKEELVRPKPQKTVEEPHVDNEVEVIELKEDTNKTKDVKLSSPVCQVRGQVDMVDDIEVIELNNELKSPIDEKDGEDEIKNEKETITEDQVVNAISKPSHTQHEEISNNITGLSEDKGDSKEYDQKDGESIMENEKFKEIGHEVQVINIVAKPTPYEPEVWLPEENNTKSESGQKELVTGTADFFDQDIGDEKQDIYLEKIHSEMSTKTDDLFIMQSESDTVNVDIESQTPEENDKNENDLIPEAIQYKSYAEDNIKIVGENKTANSEIEDKNESNLIPEATNYTSYIEDNLKTTSDTKADANNSVSNDDSVIPVASSYSTFTEDTVKESKVVKVEDVDSENIKIEEEKSDRNASNVSGDKNIMDVSVVSITENREETPENIPKSFIYKSYSSEKKTETVSVEVIKTLPNQERPVEKQASVDEADLSETENISISSTVVMEYVGSVITEAQKKEQAESSKILEAKIPDETSKQPVDEASKLPVDEASKPPVNETSKQPVDEASKLAVDEASKPPVNETSKQPVDEASKPPVDEATKQLDLASKQHVSGATTPPDDASKQPVDEASKQLVDEASKPPVHEASIHGKAENVQTTEADEQKSICSEPDISVSSSVVEAYVSDVIQTVKGREMPSVKQEQSIGQRKEDIVNNETTPAKTVPNDTNISETVNNDTKPSEISAVDTKPSEIAAIDTKPAEIVVIDTKPNETVIVDTKQAEIAVVDSKPTEVVFINSKQAEVVVVDSKQTKTVMVEKKSTEVVVIDRKPAETEAIDTTPAETVAIDTKPAETVAVDTKPAKTVAVDPKPAEIVAIDTKPAETVAIDTKAAETVAVDPKPAEIVAIDTKPAETVAIETKPAETVAIDTKPVEIVAIDTKPAETVAIDTKPAETVAVDPKPAEIVAIDTKPAETVAIDTKPAETVAVDTNPAETVAFDTKPAETVAIDTKPAETVAVDTKPTETAATDTKPTETATEMIVEKSTESSDVVSTVDLKNVDDTGSVKSLSISSDTELSVSSTVVGEYVNGVLDTVRKDFTKKDMEVNENKEIVQEPVSHHDDKSVPVKQDVSVEQNTELKTQEPVTEIKITTENKSKDQENVNQQDSNDKKEAVEITSTDLGRGVEADEVSVSSTDVLNYVGEIVQIAKEEITKNEQSRDVNKSKMADSSQPATEHKNEEKVVVVDSEVHTKKIILNEKINSNEDSDQKEATSNDNVPLTPRTDPEGQESDEKSARIDTDSSSLQDVTKTSEYDQNDGESIMENEKFKEAGRKVQVINMVTKPSTTEQELGLTEETCTKSGSDRKELVNVTADFFDQDIVDEKQNIYLEKIQSEMATNKQKSPDRLVDIARGAVQENMKSDVKRSLEKSNVTDVQSDKTSSVGHIKPEINIVNVDINSDELKSDTVIPSEATKGGENTEQMEDTVNQADNSKNRTTIPDEKLESSDNQSEKKEISQKVKSIEKKVLPDEEIIDKVIKPDESTLEGCEEQMGAVKVAVLESGMVGSIAAMIHIESDESRKTSISSLVDADVNTSERFSVETSDSKQEETSEKTVSDTKPAKIVVTETKIVTESKSAETVEETNSTDTITEINPAETVIDTKPQETVTSIDEDKDISVSSSVVEAYVSDVISTVKGREMSSNNQNQTESQEKEEIVINETKTSEAIIETKQIETATETTTKAKPTEIVTVTKAAETVTETKPAKTVTDIKPVETVTVTKPSETVTETKPADTVTETKPAETVTETKPAETVTETKPTETVTETKTTEAVTVTKPAEIVTETKTAEIVTETKLTETVTETKPAETVPETKLAETVNETKPTETVNETKPAETVTETKPTERVTETNPVETITETNPTEAVTETKPTETVTETKPVETVTETKPVEVVTETKPVETVTETKPAEIVTETKPVETITETKPTEAVTETKPAEIVTETKPAELVTETKPVETITETKPTEAVTETKPAEIVTETKPTETVTETKPTEMITETKPTEIITETVAETKPAETVTEIKLTETVTEIKLTETVTETKTTETVTETKPAETVTETKPTETVTETNSIETVTETKPTETVTETKPAETVKETKPAETVSETKPAETVTETKPAETVAETKPADAVNEPKPAETVTETEHAETVAETKPIVTVTKIKPTETVTVTKSAEIVTETKPSETVTETKPAETITETKPTEAVTEPKPTEAVTEQKPTEIITETKPTEIVTETNSMETVTETKPAETVSETKPAETVTEAKPAETVTETKLAETVIETKPAETVTETKPAETASETKPAEIVTKTKPAETVTGPKPAETVTETKHAETVAEIKPIETVTEIKPTERVTEAKSAEIVAEPKPAETVTETKPTETVTEAKPAETVTETKQTDTVTETKPTEAVTETKPAETVTETKPAETVTETKPTEIVTETKPTEAVTETKPTEIVTETKPTEIVTETKLVETVNETKPVEAVTEPKPTETVTETKPVETVTDTNPAETAVTDSESIETVTSTKPPEMHPEHQASDKSLESAIFQAGKMGIVAVPIENEKIDDYIKEQLSSTNNLVESAIVDMGKVGIVAAPIEPENDQTNSTGNVLETALVEVGKTIVGVMHFDVEDLSNSSADNKTSNPDRNDLKTNDEELTKEGEKDATQSDTKSVYNEDKDISVTIDLSKIEMTDNKDLGQPDTCSTPKTKPENVFEMKEEKHSEDQDKNIKQETENSEVTEAALTPNIVVTSPKSPPNDDCIVEVNQSQSIKIAGNQSPENANTSNDVSQSLKSTTNQDGDKKKIEDNSDSECKQTESNEKVSESDTKSKGNEKVLEENGHVVNGEESDKSEKNTSNGTKSEDEELTAILNEIDENLNNGEKNVLKSKLKENLENKNVGKCVDIVQVEVNEPLTKTGMHHIIESGGELEIDKETLKEMKAEAYADVDVMSTISEVTTESNTQSMPKLP